MCLRKVLLKRKSQRWLAWLLLLTLPCAGAAEERVDPVPESLATAAETTSTGEAVVVPGGEDETGATEALDTAAILRREIAELRRLLNGELPSTVAVQQLFRVDLSDESAVQQRIEQLEMLVMPRPTQTQIPPVASSGGELVEPFRGGNEPDVAVPATTAENISPQAPGSADPTDDESTAAEPSVTPPQTESVPFDHTDDEGVQSTSASAETKIAASTPPSPGQQPVVPGLDIETLIHGAVEGLQEAELEDMSLRLRLLCLRQPLAVRLGWIERESARQSEKLLAEARQIAQERAKQSEQARLRAIEEGLRATSARERAVLDIKAEIESTGHALASYNADTAQFLADASTASIELHEFLSSCADEAREAGAGSPLMADLYASVFARLLEQRALIARRLELLRNMEKVPSYTGQDPGTVSPALPAETLRELRQVLERQRQERNGLKNERRKVHAQQLYVEIANESAINKLANELLEQLDEDSHDRWTGFGQEGRSLLASEIERLALERQVILYLGGQFATDRWKEFRDEESVALLVWRVLTLVFLVMLFSFGKNRLPGASAALVKAAFNHQWPLWVRRLTWRFNWAADAFGVDVLRLLIVLIAPALLGFERDSGFPGVLYQLAMAWSVYKLLFALMHAWLGAAIQTGRVRMDQERSGKLADSLHLIGRYVLVLAVILILSTPILGRGYLYNAIESLGGLGLLALLTLLAYRWRVETRDWVTQRGPGGVLAEVAGRVQRYRWGFIPTTLIAVGTAVVIVIRASLRVLSGLTAIRRVQAHLLRKKLEKSSEDDRTPTTLPERLQGILAEGGGELEPGFLVDRFHGLDAFRADFELWQRETFVGATLVTGRFGYGKTTWLSHALQGIDLPVIRIDLKSRLASSAAVVDLMRKHFDMPDGVTSLETLIDVLNQGPRRLVAVDDAQYCFIRDVGGRAGIDALCHLIEATGRNIYWLVTMSNYAYRILAWSTEGNLVFRQVVSLPEWQEDEIRALIEARMAATDWDVRTGDDADNGEGADAARVLKSTFDYLRLIWDYAEGSPAIAIAAWRSSLVPAPHQILRVRLFPQPDAALLESLTEGSRFQLAAIVMHESLTVDEVAAVTRLPRFVCEDRCNRLQEEGVLKNSDGFFRVTSLWWPVVIRFLRRKHLITVRMER